MKAEAMSGFEGQRRLQAMQLLVCGDEQSRHTANGIASRGEWSAFFDLCGRWKLLAGLEARLSTLGIALPGPERSELARRTQPAFVQTMLCVRSGTIALAALDRAGVRCAGFKGLAALAYLYPGLRSRTLQDTDVLIHPRDVEAALKVLEESGFKRSPESPWEEYVAFLRNSPGTAGNEAVSLRDERGGAVDLHWHLGTLDVETLLASADSVTMLNRPIPLMRAGHCMLLSVHHALRNDFVPADIARDVTDFAHWQELLQEKQQWQSLSADASQWGLTAACAALAQIVAQLRDIQNVEPPLPLTRSDRALAKQLADLYFRQLLVGEINTDLTYVTRTRPVAQIVTGLASGWNSYRDQMRRSEESNGEVTMPVHARVWRLAKAMAGLSPSGWRQVRALARAKDTIAGPRRPT